ncbi:hypothetical protein [Serratia marcescens]|uniref:hypothetical protein n=1 Tax=Serratia marcescens TaxID=615 RepID=UPI001F0C5E21|nr:hypothetical protein [Serratia marcescens]
MMPLDHGILNLPLSKRGNFHKELDDHLKAEKQRKAREICDAKAEFEEAKRVAKTLFDVMDADLIKQEAKRRGIKISELKQVLRDIRDFKPRLAPKAFEIFIKVA